MGWWTPDWLSHSPAHWPRSGALDRSVSTVLWGQGAWGCPQGGEGCWVGRGLAHTRVTTPFLQGMSPARRDARGLPWDMGPSGVGRSCGLTESGVP